MALQVYWYDFVCFGIVGISLCCALCVIWMREGSSRQHVQETTAYESLLVARPDTDDDLLITALLPTGHVGSSQLWSSCWKGVSPKWLLLTRSLSLLVLGACLAWDIVDWGGTIFVYYTEWTFALVMVYFALGIVVSAHGCWLSSNQPAIENGETEFLTSGDLEESRKASDTNNGGAYTATQTKAGIKLKSGNGQQEIGEQAGFCGYLMQTIFQTCAGAVILTDIVFWLIIVPFLSNSHLGLNLLMGCMHTLNAAFVLLDTALNSVPFPWFRLSYFVLWSCLYVVFQWIIHACGFSWWPYPFLELDTPWAPLWYFCLAVIHIPCYGIFALIVKAKYTILPKWFPRAFVRSY